jgi:hypothetical protein
MSNAAGVEKSASLENSESDEGGSTCDNYMPRVNTDTTRVLLKRFLCICTGSKIMDVGTHWDLFGKFRMNIGSADPTQMSTWFPRHYVPVFIVGLGDRKTAFYVHATNEMYSISCAIDGPKLPMGTVLCANYTEDREHNVNSPRLLIFDLAMLHGERVRDPAEKRYATLRKLYDDFFRCDDSINRNLFTLQWVGYYSHSKVFLDGKVDVKHHIGGILALTENAINPIRTIQIKLPLYVQDQNIFVQRQRSVDEGRGVSLIHASPVILHTDAVRKSVTSGAHEKESVVSPPPATNNAVSAPAPRPKPPPPPPPPKVPVFEKSVEVVVGAKRKAPVGKDVEGLSGVHTPPKKQFKQTTLSAMFAGAAGASK